MSSTKSKKRSASKAASTPQHLSGADESARPKNIKDLAEVLFKFGPEATKRLLASYKHESGSWVVQKEHDGDPAWRADLPTQTDKTDYLDFSPPALWGATYSVMRVHFVDRVGEDYMYHSGQEWLFPIEGKVHYDFFLPDKETKLPGRASVEVAPGQALLAQCQVPHRTRAVSGNASAWMVFQDITESNVSIRTAKFSKKLHRRLVSESKLEASPEVYSITALGLTDLLRAHHMKSGLALQTLAELSGVNRSQITSTELGAKGLPLDALVSLGRILGFDALEPFKKELWGFHTATLPAISARESGKEHVAALADLCVMDTKREIFEPHYLHAKIWNLHEADLEPHLVKPPEKVAFGDMQSWVVLNGEAIFSVQKGAISDKMIALRNSVVHFRNIADLRITIKATENCQLLEIYHSAICPNARHQEK